MFIVINDNLIKVLEIYFRVYEFLFDFECKLMIIVYEIDGKYVFIIKGVLDVLFVKVIYVNNYGFIEKVIFVIIDIFI